MSTHSIVHVELSASDPKAAGEFYAGLFGWQIETHAPTGYVQFSPEDGPAGGFEPVSDDQPAGTVLIYVQTDDIEATLTKAESLGGRTVVPKTEIPTVGWFGVFADPTGNQIGLYTGGSE